MNAGWEGACGAVPTDADARERVLAEAANDTEDDKFFRLLLMAALEGLLDSDSDALVAN